MCFFERIEAFLWRKGFFHAALRCALRNLFVFSSCFFLVGTVLLLWTPHFFWAGAMSVLSCWNFYSLACFIQRALPAVIPETDRRGAGTARVVKKGLLFRTNLRLCITGILVYIALVTFQANPVALAAGLSASVIIIPISLIFRR